MILPDRTPFIHKIIQAAVLVTLGVVLLASGWVEFVLTWPLDEKAKVASSSIWLRWWMDVGLLGLATGGLIWAWRLCGLYKLRWDWGSSIAMGLPVIVLLWAVALYMSRSTVIEGQRVWWLGDDAMVSMRYARHLAQGHGLTFGSGEPVEGYSNLWWTLVMTGVHGLGVPLAWTSAFMYGLQLFFGSALLFAVAHLYRRLGGAGGVGLWFALVFVAFHGDVFSCLSVGLESIFLAVCWLFLLTRGLREIEKSELAPWTIIMGGFLALIRVDGLLWFALLLLVWAIVRAPGRGRAWMRWIPWALLPVLAQLSFRLAYYGQWLSNTSVLKLGDSSGHGFYGLQYAGRLLLDLAPVLLLALFSLAGKWIRARMAVFLSALVPFVYVAWIGGDFFPFFRLGIAATIAIVVLAGLGLDRLAPAGKLIFVVLALWQAPMIIPEFPRYLGKPDQAIEQVEFGLKMAAWKAEGVVLASAWAGRVFYFSDLEAVDLLGKTDPYIARQQARPGMWMPGHNKFDFDYSLGKLKPTLLFADFVPGIHSIERLGNFKGYNRQLFTHPLFQKNCWPDPVLVGRRSSVFRCRWNQE